MEDVVKNKACMQEFSPENIEKVPALLSMSKNVGFLHFNMAFVNLEIVAAYLIKSKEWFFGVYEGQFYYGYLYYGNLDLEKQFSVIKDFFPQNRNHIQEFVKKYKGRIDYHVSTPDAWAIIGEYEKKTTIAKPIKIEDNYQNPLQ